MAVSYCEYIRSERAHPVHAAYHDTEYGFPQRDDTTLFERLVLEINQAGLSWETVLKKREAFRSAYSEFDPARVAAYTEDDVQRLLADAGIIRNRLKVHAAIFNAQEVLKIREEHGSFAAWLDAHHPREKADWVKLFRSRFRFVGGEIVGEFLMSLGYLHGAHDADCPIHAQILRLAPPWHKGSSLDS
jgi:DNA-3-methyladenine glycosylase I